MSAILDYRDVEPQLRSSACRCPTPPMPIEYRPGELHAVGKLSLHHAPESISLGKFIDGRLPSRAVLDKLRPYLPDVDQAGTPAARAFVALYRAVTAHAGALDHLDRAERALGLRWEGRKAVRGRRGSRSRTAGGRRIASKRPGEANEPL